MAIAALQCWIMDYNPVCSQGWTAQSPCAAAKDVSRPVLLHDKCDLQIVKIVSCSMICGLQQCKVSCRSLCAEHLLDWCCRPWLKCSDRPVCPFSHVCWQLYCWCTGEGMCYTGSLRVQSEPILCACTPLQNRLWCVRH